MNGKQLKDWASRISDEAVIAVYDDYGRWQSKFKMRASLVVDIDTDESTKATTKDEL